MQESLGPATKPMLQSRGGADLQSVASMGVPSEGLVVDPRWHVLLHMLRMLGSVQLLRRRRLLLLVLLLLLQLLVLLAGLLLALLLLLLLLLLALSSLLGDKRVGL